MSYEYDFGPFTTAEEPPQGWNRWFNFARGTMAYCAHCQQVIIKAHQQWYHAAKSWDVRRGPEVWFWSPASERQRAGMLPCIGARP